MPKKKNNKKNIKKRKTVKKVIVKNKLTINEKKNEKNILKTLVLIVVFLSILFLIVYMIDIEQNDGKLLGNAINFEEGGTGNIVISVLIGFVILAIVAGVGFVFFEKERAHKELEKEKQKRVTDVNTLIQLNKYIAQTMSMGYNKDKIKRTLINEGWNPGIIEKVFSNK